MDVPTLLRRPLVIFVVVLPVVSSSPVPLDSLPHGDISVEWCHFCPAGTYMEVTCLPGKPDSASCTPCPEGTYRRKPNHARFCHPHKISCSAPYQIKEPVQLGDNAHDAVCHCEHGTIKISNNQCVKRKSCRPGKGMTKGGKCKQCKEGTFSDRRSKFQKCQPITDCAQEGKETLYPGSVTSDARCGGLLSTKSVTEIILTANHLNSDERLTLKQLLEQTTEKLIDKIGGKNVHAIISENEAPTTEARTQAKTVLVQKQTSGRKMTIQDGDRPDKVFILEPTVKVSAVTESYGSHISTLDMQDPAQPFLRDFMATASSPGLPADNTSKINLIIAITSLCFVALVMCISLLVVVCRYVKIIVKQKAGDTALLIEERRGHRGDDGENTGYQEEIEVMPPLSQEQSHSEQPSPHADLQGAEGFTELSKEDISSRKEVEIQPLSVPAAVVRPKQRSLTSQPTVPSSEEDSLQYPGSLDEDETVPLLLRDSHEISSTKEPSMFKATGLEVALHPTPPLKEDNASLSSIKEDTPEPSVPRQTLPTEAAEVQEIEEEQPTVDSEHVEELPSDAGLPSEPNETIREKDEDETDLKQVSGEPEGTEVIPPDIEEIARTAMVRVPSDELSFPVQESSHDTDGLEALGAVGGRSESYSPLPSTDADSDQSSGDEAYERKVRLAIRDSVAKSLFTGLAHHLSNPAGPGPDWVPLARAAGISGPEIDHIINQAAQELDKDIRKMLERYEEGKTGDRPISELYGELIARKRQQLYDTFRRDRPS